MRYIEPEMEIMELEQDDIVTLSTDGNSQPGTGGIPFVGPPTGQAF